MLEVRMKFSSKQTYKLFLKIIGFVCLGLFFLFSFFVNTGAFLPIDLYVNEVFGGGFKGIFFLYSKILEYLYLFLSLLCFRLLYKFYRRGEKMEALLLTVVAVASVFSQFFVKPIFNVLCPGSYYNSVFKTYKLVANSELFQKFALKETCYPSNHTVGYIVVCGYLALLMYTYFPKKKETSTIISLLLFIIATVGLTRIYLHVHWFSDVVAGYLLGGFFLCVIFWLRLHRKEFKEVMKVLYAKLEKNKRK